MRSIQLSHMSVAALLAMASVTSAHAQQAGDTIVAIGAARVSPDLSLGALTSVGPFASAFNPVTAGATASAGYAETLSFSVLRMFTNNVAVEFSLGVPPTINVDVYLPSSSLSLSRAAKADVLTPAAVAKYLFLNPTDNFRPYAGLGLTYASFRNVRADTSNATLNLLAGTSSALSSSWAPVYNLGFIYNFTDRLSVNASVSYIPFKTDITFVGSGTTTTGSMDVNPTDYVVRIGYKF